MPFKIEFGEKYYRIISPDDQVESKVVGFCEAATILWNDKVYIAFLTGAEGEVPKVYEAESWPSLPAVDTVSEEVDFDMDHKIQAGECPRCEGWGVLMVDDPDNPPDAEEDEEVEVVD